MSGDRVSVVMPDGGPGATAWSAVPNEGMDESVLVMTGFVRVVRVVVSGAVCVHAFASIAGERIVDEDVESGSSVAAESFKRRSDDACGAAGALTRPRAGARAWSGASMAPAAEQSLVPHS